MSSTFDIQVRAPADFGDGATGSLPSVAIRAGDEVLTRLLRPGDEQPDDYLAAPPAQFAFWLVDNWWRLRWESIPPSGRSPEWRLAHELSAIGGGFVWPRVGIWGEGERIGIVSQRDPVGVTTPVRFLTDAVLFVEGMEFEARVDGFISEVIERWTTTSDALALQSQVAALRAERSDTGFSGWRRLEARLGFDPDEAPYGVIEALHRFSDVYGKAGVEEAAQAAPGADAAATLAREIDFAMQAHVECDLSLACEQVARAGFRIDQRREPWENAEAAAAVVLEFTGRRRGLLRNRSFGEIVGMTAGSLLTSRSVAAREMPYGLRLRAEKPGSDIVLLLSRWPEARRFELARALGDAIWSSHDKIGPLGRSGTPRQRFQRAFAQSLLCPFDSLLAYIGTRAPTEADITAAAKHFEVSEGVVRTVLVNKRVLSRGSLRQSPAGGPTLDELIDAA